MSEREDLGLSPHGVPVAEVIPLRGVYKMIADHMMRSHLGYAAYTIMGEVDLQAFEVFRKELVAKVEDEFGVHISFTHLVVKVLGQSLREHPIMNSTLVEDVACKVVTPHAPYHPTASRPNRLLLVRQSRQ